MLFPTLRSVEIIYRDDPAVHGDIYRSFAEAVEATPALRRHRDHIEQNGHGYGDRALHWLWKLLVDEMPAAFRFLEIGVYKGQVISLVGMLAQQTGKDGYLFGVTPMSPAGDKHLTFASIDYAVAIRELQSWSGVPLSRQARILHGFSNDEAIKSLCRTLAPFDMVYIDGCHDFHVVVNDLIVYGELVKPGGYLIVDNASTELSMPPGSIWTGLADVSEACRRILDPDIRFTEVCAVGHIRVWRKRAKG